VGLRRGCPGGRSSPVAASSAATGFEARRPRIESSAFYTVMVVWNQVPFPYTNVNAQRPERVGSRLAAGVHFLGSYGTLGTACEVASRAVGLSVLAAGSRPYIDVMHGRFTRCRLVIISTPTSGEGEQVDIGDDSQYVNIKTPNEFLPGTAALRIAPPTASGINGQPTRNPYGYHRSFRSCGPIVTLLRKSSQMDQRVPSFRDRARVADSICSRAPRPAANGSTSSSSTVDPFTKLSPTRNDPLISRASLRKHFIS
jgi:hypothetical protein